MNSLLTFIETALFSRQIVNLVTDEEYAKFQWRLMQLPDIGDVIPGGGIRKIRIGSKSKGKRAGARVIYYFAASRHQIFMLDAYAKNEQSDLTLPRLRELKKIVNDLQTR